MTRAQAFGRYELLQRISMGGMAEVFRATHLPSSTQVALKRILQEVSEDEDFIKMFEDEARIASQLEHPYIARCLDFGHVDGEWYIAFEYVDGKDLRVLFDRCARTGESPPLWFLVYVFSRIGEGLAYAHARKDKSGQPVSIVHRDVSPQNIIVSFSGDVKLIDFGIAKAAGRLSRTQVGSIKGKFGYMSPEQVRGLEVDQRTDIFSMGICMWELLTRRRLFQADNELLVIEKVRSLQVEPPSRYNQQCPPELDRVVLKALAKDPDERYRAAKDVYKDLNHVAGTRAGLASREQIAQYMRRTFPEAPQGSDGMVSARQVREMSNMATNEKGGSDLDIFEGLGKKGPSARPSAPPSARGTPPPPPSTRMPAVDPKRTLLGVSAPTPPPPPSSVAPPSASRTPPPPPGRGALPAVVAPPQRSITPVPATKAGVAPPPAPAPTSPAPVAASAAQTAPNAAVEMDWDDEDEATHIFDKGDDMPMLNAAPIPAAGTPAPAAALPKAKSTLLGLTSPVGAPPPSSAPPRSVPPPPPPSAAFARASGGASAAPGPSAFPPPPSIHPVPPPPATQQGLGGPMPPPRSAPPPPVQVAPAPMAMPAPAPMPTARPLSAPAPGPAGSTPDYGGPQLALPRSMEATALVRPPQNRTGLFVGLGVGALALVGVAAFLLMPHTGRLLINVGDAKGSAVNRVDIFVDGRKQCDTAPCIVEQVSAGSHEVKVLADGYQTPPMQTINVEARKDANATFTMSSTSSGAGLKVGGTQSGVKLYVDDKEIGPLPQELHDLAPGDHVIKVAGSERYQPLEKHVTIEKDKIEDLGTITLKVLKGKATISLGTPGARVYLVSGSDRRELPMLPISVDIDTAKTWALQASKAGYGDYSQPISFDDGQAEKTYVVTLEPRGSAASAPAYNPAPAPAPRPAPQPQPQPEPVAAAPASAGGEAYLNINSIPPSTCILDGRSLGSTPRVHVSVKPGTHTVKFVNADQGLTKTVTVTVGSGETKPAVAKLN